MLVTLLNILFPDTGKSKNLLTNLYSNIEVIFYRVNPKRSVMPMLKEPTRQCQVSCKACCCLYLFFFFFVSTQFWLELVGGTTTN